jgi:hypothetical protein
MKPNVVIFNAETQEEIIREMNDEEYAQQQIDVAASEERAEKRAEQDALAESKKAAKAEALAALGLSQEIINLLAE